MTAAATGSDEDLHAVGELSEARAGAAGDFSFFNAGLSQTCARGNVRRDVVCVLARVDVGRHRAAFSRNVDLAQGDGKKRAVLEALSPGLSERIVHVRPDGSGRSRVLHYVTAAAALDEELLASRDVCTRLDVRYLLSTRELVLAAAGGNEQGYERQGSDKTQRSSWIAHRPAYLIGSGCRVARLTGRRA